LECTGRKILYGFRIIGEVLILLKRTLFSFREAPRNLRSIFTQMAIIGYETVPIASVVLSFMLILIADYFLTRLLM
jgi:phospholipid/cholesterol/gamma-HCH transport system permease protein